MDSVIQSIPIVPNLNSIKVDECHTLMEDSIPQKYSFLNVSVILKYCLINTHLYVNTYIYV